MADPDNKVAIVADDRSIPEVEKTPVDPEDIYIDPAKERKLLWKIDAFLVPLLPLSFLSAYLDRSNIGNAAIAGMPEDLGMSKQELASMFPSYDQKPRTRPETNLPGPLQMPSLCSTSP